MTEVSFRVLRDNVESLLERVAAGESITITVGGRAVAVLEPVGRRPRWLSRDDFIGRFHGRQTDPGLAEDLRELGGGMTSDVP